MELRQYLRVIRRGWLVIVALTILGGAVGVALTVFTKPVYRSQVQLFVSLSAQTDTTNLAGSNAFTSDRVQSYVDLADSSSVANGAFDWLKDPVLPDGTKLNPITLNKPIDEQTLKRNITATVPQDRVVITLAVTSSNPTDAANLTNAVAASFKKQIQSYDKQGSTSLVSLSQVDPATVNTTPVSPRRTLNIVIGLAVGLLLGVGGVTLRDVLDNTVKGPADFDKLNLPVLGAVPFDKRAARSPVAFRTDPHSARSEAFRGLRTNMQFVDVDRPARIIAVTSAMPGEGKSTTSINLAASLAEAGWRVCIMDADLRRPSIAKYLGLIENVGLTNALISDTPIEELLQNAGRNLAVLASGPIPPNPSELLISDQARSLIASIAEKVDYVVIDTPPLLPVVDGAELATIVDATVLVARARRTTVDQTQRAIEALEKVGRRPVGVVLNMLSAGRTNDYQYGYYYAPYRPETKRRKRRGKDEAETAETAATPAVEVEDTDAPLTDADAPDSTTTSDDLSVVTGREH